MEQSKKPLSAETGMLIRKPVAEVFDAFIDPAITTKFWFTKSTGKLEKGKRVVWTWEMYNVSGEVNVIDIVPNKRIEVSWVNGGELLRVEWTFKILGEQSTFVNILMDGFTGDIKSVVESVSGNVGGFTWVLAGLKAYLEHNIQLNLIADRFPEGK